MCPSGHILNRFSVVLHLKPAVGEAVQGEDDDGLYKIGYQVTVPQPLGHETGHKPQHRDDSERQGKGDEKGHAVMTIELVHYHQHVDVAERYETQCENPERMVGLAHQFGGIGTEEFGYALGPHPYEHAGDEHRHSDEAERQAKDIAKALYILLAHLDGAQRLYGAAGACKEEVIHLQEVQTYGKGEDAGTSQGVGDDGVG